jgi:tetratricopeptide (TPR) repeat protein
MSLSNYANYLGDLGQSQQAAEVAKKALDIREKLASAQPERFEPDYAMSLNNYANRLGELGQCQQAAEFAKKALDIHEKLSHAQPERFEPDYATTLSNYASHLSSLGQSQQATECAKQALDIREKLASAQPERFEFDFISSVLYLALCTWLAEQGPLATEFPQPQHSSPRQQRLLRFWGSVLRCFASERSDALSSALDDAAGDWLALDKTQQRQGEAFRLLAAGLAESRGIGNALTEGWRTELARYRAQRAGWLPWWMEEVARRQGFFELVRI